MNILKKSFEKCRIKSEKTFYYLIALLTLLLVLNAGIFQSSIIAIFASLLAFYLLFFSDGQKRIAFFAFFFFFSSIFKIPGISTSVFTILITLYVTFEIILLFINNKDSLKKLFLDIKMVLIFFVILSFQLFLLFIVFEKDGADLRSTISFLIYLLFPIALYFFEKKNIYFEKILQIFALGILISSLTTLPCFFSEQYGLNLYQYAGQQKFVYSYISINNYNLRIYRFSGLAFDPNYYSYFSLSTISLLAIMYLTKNNKMSILLAAILSVLVILTFSKMMIVLFSILVIVFFTFLLKTKKAKIANILIVSCLAIFIILLTIGPTLVSVITSRFNEGQSFDFESALNSLSTGRFNIWKDFVKMLFDNPLILFFGSGVGSAYNTIASGGYGAHNSLLETISTMGILGLILLFLFFKFIYDYCANKELSVSEQQNRHLKIPLSILLMLLVPQVALLFLGIASSFGFAFLLLVLFLSIQNIKNFYEHQNSMRVGVVNG